VFLFFGLVAVLGTYYAQVKNLDPEVWVAAIPVGTLATAILVVNNLRDRTGDARAGKRTLAVRLGRGGAIVEYAALVAIAYAVPLALAIQRPWAALPVVTAPLAVKRVRDLARCADGPSFNRALASTAGLLVAHGVLFTLGLALSRA